MYKFFYLLLVISGLICGRVFAMQDSTYFTVHDVSPASPSSTFSFYHTCPESPDGSLLLYTLFDEVPLSSPGSTTAGALWLQNLETGDDIKLVDLYGIQPHDGAMAMWIDNETVVYQDGKLRFINNPPEYTRYEGFPPVEQLNSINIKTGEKRTFGIQGRMGHNTVNGKFPVSVMHPINGYHGVYLIDTYSGEPSQVCVPVHRSHRRDAVSGQMD